jgi:hypothetical protein
MSPALAISSKMATSNSATLFIDKGAVFGVGKQVNGHVDMSTGAQSYGFTPVFTGKTHAVSVALTDSRSAILMVDGKAELGGYQFSRNQPMTPQPFPASGITDFALVDRMVYYIVRSRLFAWTGEPGAVPSEVPGGAGARQIAGGYQHLVVLFTDGSVATIGANLYGQLGNGTTAASSVLTRIAGLAGVAVAAGQYHSLVLHADGTVSGFGKNTSAEFGTGSSGLQLTPIKIPGLSDVKKVSMGGGNVTVALKKDGSVSACGWHNYIAGSIYNISQSCETLPVGKTTIDINDGWMGRIMLDRGVSGERAGWGGNLYCALGNGDVAWIPHCKESHSISTTYFTPVTPPAGSQATVDEAKAKADAAAKAEAAADTKAKAAADAKAKADAEANLTFSTRRCFHAIRAGLLAQVVDS